MATYSEDGNDPSSLDSLHTANFPSLLRELGISLLVSTYQTGKVVIVRADGDDLNTHFCSFSSPMGLALSGNRLAIGTAREIWEFRDAPRNFSTPQTSDRVDASFLPRRCHVTGNVQVHEMAWGNEGLWFVNTRFSCLATLDEEHSFVPRWRPPFITRLAPEDRCHLNGLEVVDGKPRYVSAVGESDTPGGWRPKKGRGGVLIDVQTGEIIARGLSMPHSPRWHDDRLWLLESGTGTVGIVDPQTGRYEAICMLPGFTRGLSFLDGLAFVGLSQVRETAIFSGIPITEQLTERACGVWVIELATGRTVAFLRFENALREIFAVQVLPGRIFPELIHEDDGQLADSFVLPERIRNASTSVPCQL